MHDEVFGVSVQTWSAVGSIATAVGVLAAAIGVWVARGQWKQAKATRLDQSRPYVVVTIETASTMFGLVDIVVRNVGAGPAHGVTITVDPPLERAKQTQDVAAPIAEARYFNEAIPLMPPGYELRTFFDDMRERHKSDLPSRYTFTVAYDDGHGNAWKEPNVVDLGLLDGLLFTEVLGTHHVAKAVRDIEKHLKGSKLLKGDIAATVETRSERADREERFWAEQEQMFARMREQSDAQQNPVGNDDGADTP